jgi:hypothetical protein
MYELLREGSPEWVCVVGTSAKGAVTAQSVDSGLEPGDSNARTFSRNVGLERFA